MPGIISFDFFTLRKKVSAYVCMLIPPAFVVLYYFIGISVEMHTVSMQELFWFGSSLLPISLGIFYALFAGNDRKKGYIKNIAGSLPHRISYVLSKALLLALYTVVSVGLLLLTSLILSRGEKPILFGTEMSNADFLCAVGILVLLLLAFMFCVIFVSVLTAGTSGAVIFALLYGTRMLSSLVYSLLDMLMAKYDIEFDFTKISLSMKLYMCESLETAEEIRNAMTVGIVYLLIFGTLSCVVFRRKDIT